MAPEELEEIRRNATSYVALWRRDYGPRARLPLGRRPDLPPSGHPIDIPTRGGLMPLHTRYLFSAAMDVDPSKDALFHEVYDKEHIPALLEVPGVVSAARFKVRELTLMIGGERKTIVVEGEPRYNALYEVESPEVLVTPAWARAVERGRWPTEVRAFTRNRRHLLYERL